MLRLVKKHLAACGKKSVNDWKCSKGVRCPFYIRGPHPTDKNGGLIVKYTGTSNEQTARMFLQDFERDLYDPKPEPQPEKPKLPLTEAIDLYVKTKKHRSIPRQRKLKLQLGRMAEYLEKTFGHKAALDVRNLDLQQFMTTWDGEYTTLKTERENMKGFWRWCANSDITLKNIAVDLPHIGDPRKEKERVPPTLTPKEVTQIFKATETCGEIYKKGGLNVAKQVRAFTMIERYTGLAVGDVSKLRLDEVNRNTNEIFLHRKKTGEPVWTVVPSFVIEALYSFQADSNEYFFWSGQGLLHTRTSKWGERLQKLYVYAGVRVTEEEKVRRSGGRLKEKAERVLVSAVTPHWWRHTFVRDLYLQGKPVSLIADLIGDEEETVRKYYSSFDELRKQKLKSEIESVWANDPLTQELRSQSRHS
jgi:integrase